MSRRVRHDWLLSLVRANRRQVKGRNAAKCVLSLHRRLRVETLEDRRLLALVTVDTLADTFNFNDSLTSLREAIFATNLVGGADTIDFAPALTSGGPATLKLTQGELKITDSLAINGPGAHLLTIDASTSDPTPNTNNGDGSRVFNIDDGNINTFKIASIRGLTLTGGDVSGTIGGGGVFSREHLSVAQSTISGNSTNSRGGGIYMRFGNLTLTDSTIGGNAAVGGGGGIYSRGMSQAPNAVTVSGSTIGGNSTGAHGGGIACVITNLSVTGSAISGNSASNEGGGVFASGGMATVTGSAIGGNVAGTIGGGISGRVGSDITVATSTIAGNSARNGGGVRSSAGLTLTNATIADNVATGNGGGVLISTEGALTMIGGAITGNSAGSGGGIFGSGLVTVTGGTISGNVATNGGGGIWNSGGIATLTGTTIRDNSARDGGGIYNSGAGSHVTVTSSTIRDNAASRSGGGIYNRTVLTVNASTIRGNSAVVAGGGIFSFGGNLTVTASTISSNLADFGGGIAGGTSGNVVTVSSSIVSGNTASNRAGGILNGAGSKLTVSHSTVSSNAANNKNGGIGAYGATTLDHAIVAGNTRDAGTHSDLGGSATMAFSLLGVDSGATIADNGGNLIGSAAGPVDPLLGPLADNGGPTMTHALLAFSPAINTGDPAAVAGMGGVPLNDQRGAPFTRVSGGRIDIGAFEAQPIVPPAFLGVGQALPDISNRRQAEPDLRTHSLAAWATVAVAAPFENPQPKAGGMSNSATIAARHDHALLAWLAAGNSDRTPDAVQEAIADDARGTAAELDDLFATLGAQGEL